MANRNIFQNIRGLLVPATDTTNDAGGRAYALSPEAALARLAATGCFNGTFYASAETQLERVLELANEVDVDFLARTALYARRRAFMKDMPAALCAVLATRDVERLEEIFPQVIDNGKMLRNFVQIVRSGVTGRKSLGSAPRRCVRRWLERAEERRLLEASVGQNPSLADVVKMTRPCPADPVREAFYGWLVGKEVEAGRLPPLTRAFEEFKRAPSGEPPDIPFQLLTALSIRPEGWKTIASRAGWQLTRMNLNTFARHGVFEDTAMVKLISQRLANPELVRRARAFPYQLLTAYRSVDKAIPKRIREAIQDAMEAALANVPSLAGQVVVCPDVSGSMGSAITGYRKGSTSATRCVDVAGLITAAILRKNPDAFILPFEQSVVSLELNPRDTVMTNATKLASVGGGGTNCAAPLQELNRLRYRADLVIFVSDNESWIQGSGTGRGTAMAREWEVFRQSNPRAKLVCIDLQPNLTAQIPEKQDILHVGGFSDQVFDLLAAFASSTGQPDYWIREIMKEEIIERKLAG
jgi:60 kDa SS-A/Ro ribonucleoprotein